MVSPYRDEAEDTEQRPPRYELRADESVLAVLEVVEADQPWLMCKVTYVVPAEQWVKPWWNFTNQASELLRDDDRWRAALREMWELGLSLHEEAPQRFDDNLDLHFLLHLDPTTGGWFRWSSTPNVRNPSVPEPEMVDWSALGQNAWRCRGISSWQDVEALGRGSCMALLTHLRAAANHALVDGARGDLHLLSAMIERTAAIAERSVPKPILPRLRSRVFEPGDDVQIFLGEIAAETRWVPAKVVEVEKAFKPEWATITTTRDGYYWRATAELLQEVRGVPKRVSFSTSEPRVLLKKDREWLLNERENERHFLILFSRNAVRSWPPLWCQELGVEIEAPDEVSVYRWFSWS